MKLFGIENIIVTNAAGGLNSEYKEGDIMMISDHINLPGFTGAHPLKGPNDDRFIQIAKDSQYSKTMFVINISFYFNFRFGCRFFALNNCYDPSFRQMAREVANEIGMENNFHEGVYAMLGGPNFGNMKKEYNSSGTIKRNPKNLEIVHENAINSFFF